MSTRVAALDLGTNTFLCLVADVEGGRITKVLHDEVRIVRLGEGVHKNRRFSDGALSRARGCLTDFGKTIRKFGAEKVVAVATSAARDATNKQDLFEIGRECEIPIRVIAGETEARLTFQGMLLPGFEPESIVGVDIGGGSTELVWSKQGQISGQSFDVGCVRLAEMFIKNNPVPKSESDALRSHAKNILKGFKGPRPEKVIAVAGTPTTLAALDLGISFNAGKIEGYRLSRKKIQDWEAGLARMSIEERVKLKSLERGRADVIVPGAILLDLCSEILGVDEVYVSVRGIRYGVAMAIEKMSPDEFH